MGTITPCMYEHPTEQASASRHPPCPYRGALHIPHTVNAMIPVKRVRLSIPLHFIRSEEGPQVKIHRGESGQGIL